MTAFVSETGLANVVAAWNAYASRPVYFQGGSGSGQTITDNDLAAAEQGRVLGASEQETTNVAGDTFKTTGTITAASDISISEVGVFDAANGGNMVIYGDGFATVDLAVGDSVVFAARVIVSQD